MATQKSTQRSRVGRVTIYEHHGAWYTYHRQNGRPIRQRVGSSEAHAECVASLLNAKLTAAGSGLALNDLLQAVLPDVPRPNNHSVGAADGSSGPTIKVAELQRQFLDHHEHVLHSAMSTVSRYSSATNHLAAFAKGQSLADAAKVCVEGFVTHLRTIEVAPNGHANTIRRKLRDKGIKYILETCRSMYNFGLRQKIVAVNPFVEFAVGKLRVRDAKPIFVFTAQQELAFFKSADPWGLAVHLTLAKTGLRPGELVHTLIEDVDLDGGWLHVRSKPELGWMVKTGRERRVPLVGQLIDQLRHVAGERPSGPLFLRTKINNDGGPKIATDRIGMAKVAALRIMEADKASASPLTRTQLASFHRSVWRDAGAIPVDRVRSSFIRIATRAGLTVTTPKSWRHTFATLLQEANVDLLVRQETMGHQPTSPDAGVLGMTGTYTHTQPSFQRSEIERAVQLRPRSLALIQQLNPT